MADVWAEVTVEDLAADGPNAMATGPFGSAIGSRFFESDGVPVVRGSNLSTDVGTRLVSDDFAYLSADKASEFHRSIARRNDLVFTCWGTIGQVGFIDKNSPYDEYVISNKQMKLTPNAAKFDPLYLYYLFSSPQVLAQLQRTAIGSSVPGFNLGQLRQVKLRVPPLRTQREIAATLGAIDDKIELNRQMNRTLEEIARAIFKSWFVDFDPVRGTAEVPDDIRQLFPNRLVDSPIGSIPDGWEVTPLGEQVEVTRGLSYTGAGLRDEGMPLHNLNSVLEGGGYKDDGIKHYTGEYRDRDIVRPGDLIVANTDLTQNARVVGSPAIIPALFGNETLYSQDLSRVRPRDRWPLTSRYLYLLLTTHRMRWTISSYANGTTVLHLAHEGLTKPRVAVPPGKVVPRFDDIIRPMFDQQEALVVESHTLADLRDTLLPKLISGEVRIRQEPQATG